MVVDPSGKRITLAWHGGHQFTTVRLVESLDGGRTWSTPQMVSEKGTMAALAYGTDGALHLVWTEGAGESSGDLVDVKYAFSPFPGAPLSPPVSLENNGYRLSTQIDYLGGYQDLKVLSDGRVRLLYLDWKAGSSRVLQRIW
jgi:hypothetical protein